jgi:hypothetical protein
MSGSYRPPGQMVFSSQVHHLISEHRRREILKESFKALFSFFPTGGTIRSIKIYFFLIRK